MPPWDVGYGDFIVPRAKTYVYLIEFAKLIIRYEEEFCERDFTYNNLTPLGKKTNFLLEKECYNQNIENIRLHLGGKV